MSPESAGGARRAGGRGAAQLRGVLRVVVQRRGDVGAQRVDDDPEHVVGHCASAPRATITGSPHSASDIGGTGGPSMNACVGSRSSAGREAPTSSRRRPGLSRRRPQASTRPFDRPTGQGRPRRRPSARVAARDARLRETVLALRRVDQADREHGGQRQRDEQRRRDAKAGARRQSQARTRRGGRRREDALALVEAPFVHVPDARLRHPDVAARHATGTAFRSPDSCETRAQRERSRRLRGGSRGSASCASIAG